jgi:hypothetical protein
MINLKAIDRAFDTERFVLHHFPNAARSGGNLIITCPKCEKDKLWVLIVDRDDVRSPAWQCFSGECSDSGRTALSLVRRLEDCDTFQALEQIAKYQKGHAPLIDLRRLVEDRLVGDVEVWTADKTRIPLPEEFIRIQQGWTRADLPPYFTERGIGPKKAHRYGLGWCNDGYFRNRLVVPVTSNGEVVFFVARYMKKNPPLCKGPKLPCKICGGTEEHKRLKKAIYPKGAKPGRYLYNFDRAKFCETIRIVEGVLDAIHVGPSAVATFGTSLSQYQLELLMHTAAKEIVIMWDRDAIDKARALADRLSDMWSVRVVELPDARDPDEHTKEDLRAMEEAATRLDTSGARRAYVISRLEQ